MTTEVKNYTIDAAGRSLGRVASEAALHLRGKNEVSFTPHLKPKVKVAVVNASKLVITQARRSKNYVRYSGYPGGLKNETLGSLINRRGYGEAIRRAVRGMIPANRLRPEIMKNLTVTD